MGGGLFLATARHDPSGQVERELLYWAVIFQ